MRKRKQSDPTGILVITYAIDRELDLEWLRNVVAECELDCADEKEKPMLCRLSMRRRKERTGKLCIFLETGIGKTNSAVNLSSLLHEISNFEIYGKPVNKIEVLNFGTAASVEARIGDVLECTRFLDRDLLKLGYGDFSDYEVVCRRPSLPESGGGPKVSCNTGDSFVTDPADAFQMRDGYVAVCDMEAYAQAMVVSSSVFPDISFRSVKYITDRIGEENSIESWEEELPAANVELTKFAEKEIRRFYGA